MSRNSIDHAEWMLRTVAKANQRGCANRSMWVELWAESYREIGGRSISMGAKACPKNTAYGLWLLGRIKDASREWQNISVCDVNRDLGKNVAYAVIAVDLLADGADYDLLDLWERVKLLYFETTGEVPANQEQGQIRLVLALAKRNTLATSGRVATPELR